MAINHQYEYYPEIYSGATEIVHIPEWETSSIYSNSGYSEIKFIRRGSFVSVSGFMNVAPNVPANTLLTILPQGLRPNKTFVVVGKSNSGTVGNTDVVFDIFNNGELKNNGVDLEGYFFINSNYWIS